MGAGLADCLNGDIWGEYQIPIQKFIKRNCLTSLKFIDDFLNKLLCM